jgi:hypothetical protein
MKESIKKHESPSDYVDRVADDFTIRTDVLIPLLEGIIVGDETRKERLARRIRNTMVRAYSPHKWTSKYLDGEITKIEGGGTFDYEFDSKAVKEALLWGKFKSVGLGRMLLPILQEALVQAIKSQNYSNSNARSYHEAGMSDGIFE